MDNRTVAFYRSIYDDLTVDREEASELTAFLAEELNPPPDKIVWLRAHAFKVGSEFLSSDNSTDQNVQLLRTINCIVHAIEQTCLEPIEDLDNAVPLDEDKLVGFYKSLFDDLSVDQEENTELFNFFVSEPPAVTPESLVQARALAFKTACEYLSDDNSSNINLLRCVNVIVHAIEKTCYKPKPYELKEQDDTFVAVESCSAMSLDDAVQHLWDLDVNRLDPNSGDYTVNVGRGKKPYWKEDNAHSPLFEQIDKSVFRDRPTYAAFVALLDNYVAQTGVSEQVTNHERQEITTFLNAVMQTGPMQFCHRYCHAKDPSNVPEDRNGFIKLLREIWFELYRRERGGGYDSSGFEHVFVGEVKKKDGEDDVTGFHNWIQLVKEEKAGRLDYRGYIKPRNCNEADADGDDHLLTIQFRWNGVEKFVGTSFIGVSPEFELALYTMCFLVGDGTENHVKLSTGTDTFNLKIKCYRMARNKIGTTFPEVTSHYD